MKEKKIKSLDLKNSQPYFLILLIELFNKDRIRKVLYKVLEIEEVRKENISIMLQNMNQILSDKGFQEEKNIVKEWVSSGVFYESLEGFYDYVNYDEDTKEFKMSLFNKSKKGREKLSFKTLRDLIKKLILHILFKSLKKNSKEYKIFKWNLPKLTVVIELFKSLRDDKNSYKIFPKILQHLEADCVIDYVTFNLSKKYPEMPLWTIHDSVCTTEDWFECMEKETYSLIEGYTEGIMPQLMVENW